jgi:hypothetical protein
MPTGLSSFLSRLRGPRAVKGICPETGIIGIAITAGDMYILSKSLTRKSKTD